MISWKRWDPEGITSFLFWELWRQRDPKFKHNQHYRQDLLLTITALAADMKSRWGCLIMGVINFPVKHLFILEIPLAKDPREISSAYTYAQHLVFFLNVRLFRLFFNTCIIFVCVFNCFQRFSKTYLICPLRSKKYSTI